MKRSLICAIIAALTTPLPIQAQTTTPPPNPLDTTPTQVQDWIYAYSDKYDINPQIPLGVAACESLYFNVDVINNRRLGSLGEVGTFQFHPNGVYWETPQAAANYSYRDPEANVAAAVYLMSQGLGPRNWVICYANWRRYYNSISI